MRHLIDPVYFQDYILAGKPEFMLKSTKNQVGEVFIVRLNKTGDKYWVKNRLREFLGRLEHIENDLYTFERSRSILLPYQEKQIEQFSWFWIRFLQNTLPPYIEIRYNGRCGHCGRELTHPESLPIGIGPDCFVKLGLTHKQLKLSQHKVLSNG